MRVNIADIQSFISHSVVIFGYLMWLLVTDNSLISVAVDNYAKWHRVPAAPTYA